MSKHSKSKRAIEQGANAVQQVDAQHELNEELHEPKQNVQKDITVGGN